MVQMNIQNSIFPGFKLCACGWTTVVWTSQRPMKNYWQLRTLVGCDDQWEKQLFVVQQQWQLFYALALMHSFQSCVANNSVLLSLVLKSCFAQFMTDKWQGHHTLQDQQDVTQEWRSPSHFSCWFAVKKTRRKKKRIWVRGWMKMRNCLLKLWFKKKSQLQILTGRVFMLWRLYFLIVPTPSTNVRRLSSESCCRWHQGREESVCSHHL